MKIQEGKFYRTRDGQRVGPMIRRNMVYFHGSGIKASENYSPDGLNSWATPKDIIEEWDVLTENPVQTKTIKSIKSGQYGLIKIQPDQTTEERVVISISHHQCQTTSASFGSKELREAIITLSQIADFLEEK